MSVRNWPQKEVTDPSGAWTQSGQVRKGRPARASIAQNMRFSPGYTYSREGTSNVLAVSAAVAGMFDWISPTDHLLAYMSGTAISRYRHSDGNILPLLTSLGSTYAPSFADLGTRLYFAGFDTAGNGAIQARVYDGATAIDTCFRPPLPAFTASSATDGGAGLCTQGTHYIGFIFQSRSGFSGLPSPVDGSQVFQPLSVTLNAGDRQINVSITLNTPADAGTGSAIYPIITRSDNPNLYYFVPDVFAVLPASSAGYTQAFTINVTDEDLAASAEPATDQFSVLTQTLAGSGPFNPQAIAAYGLRNCYVVGNKVYVSDINDPQMIAEDRNVVQVGNQRKLSTVAPLGQSLYIHGDKWTGSALDNGDFPSTWPQPATVSDAIGAPYPNCIVAKTAGQYHWVIAEAGVYVFDGAYPNRPITYMVSDLWARVNWTKAHTIQAADDIAGLKLYVAVPLDAATEPSHMFTIDYTNGLTYDTCQISLDNFGFGGFRSLAMVKELASSRTALWIGPAAAGHIVNLNLGTHDDAGGTVVHSIWESGYVRDGSDPIRSVTVRVGGADLWARGQGTMSFTPFGTDRILAVGPYGVTLSAAPGQEIHEPFDLNPVENYTFRFETNALGAWFQLSGFRAYTKPSVYNR